MSGSYKRRREGGGDEEEIQSHHYGRNYNHRYQQQGRVRYGDLAPEVKLEKRRQERQEKKEKERTLSYFKSVQRALDEQAAGAGDAYTLASIVDGFFVELINLLKADTTLHLLRNATVCRVIESALANSLLLHGKSLLYVLLGHVFDVVSSPTASYTMETLLTSLSQALSALANDVESFEAEMADGGTGIHAESGVPSTATLITCVVEELVERAEELILHEVGARAVRSIALVLGGFTIRGAPPLVHAVKFTRQLNTLGSALMHALESTFTASHSRGAADTWLSIATTPTASFIVQNLLRVCESGSGVDVAVRQRLEAIHDDGSMLLRQLLMDPLGCHIFQAYVKVPPPAAIVEACDLFANREEAASASPAALCASGSERWLQKIMHTVRDDGVEDDSVIAAIHEQTCWDRALGIVKDALDELLDPAAERAMQAVFALQDLALFAPTAVHLKRMWEQLLQPRLEMFLSTPSLAQVLVVFTRKCAFPGLPESLTNDADECDAVAREEGGNAIPKDLCQLLRVDSAQGVRYFPVAAGFQKTITTTLCTAARQLCSKGAAQFLLIDGGLQEKGFDIARFMLFFKPSASSMLLHSVDKLRLSDIEALVRQPKGSLVIQQYLRAAAAATASMAAAPKKTVPLRFLHRIAPLLPQLVGDTYAAFVVEMLYDVASLEVKEELVKHLVPIYTSLRRVEEEKKETVGEGEAEEGGGGGEGDAAGKRDSSGPHMRNFIARKVMTNCRVELYVHRPEEWTKLARRQCQLQRLLHRMSAVAS